MYEDKYIHITPPLPVPLPATPPLPVPLPASPPLPVPLPATPPLPVPLPASPPLPVPLSVPPPQFPYQAGAQRCEARAVARQHRPQFDLAWGGESRALVKHTHRELRYCVDDL